MSNNQEPKFKEFEDLVCRLIPAIKQVHTFVEPNNQTSIRISPEFGIAAEQAYRLDTVGTGVQEILYLASSIWLSADDSIIIIEEPERGLHASSQRKLLDAALAHCTTGKLRTPSFQGLQSIFWAQRKVGVSNSTILGET